MDLRPWGYVTGDLVSINLLGKPIVFIGSLDVAQDLLDKRSSIYSDRSKSIVAGMAHYDSTLPLIGYNDKMKRIRRMFTKAIGTRSLMEDFAS